MRLIRPQTTGVLGERDLPVEMNHGVILLADRWGRGPARADGLATLRWLPASPGIAIGSG